MLPPDEWAKLADTELAAVWPALRPDFCRVLAVEDHDRIVGCWGLVQIAHCEGLWRHPDYAGNAAVNRHLWLGMRALTAQEGVRAVFTASVDPMIDRLILAHGGKAVPGTHYILPMEGR